MRFKYGCNPHQSFAQVLPLDAAKMPVEVLNGSPGFINFLDALNAWQLVREVRLALQLPAAASFKHVSPAGAAVATPLSEDLVRCYEVEGKELSPAATAYIRARGADPKSSFGDFVALSDVVDVPTAKFLKPLVSDGIIAPGYEAGALEILKNKKKGGFIVLAADPDFVAPQREGREIFGMRMEQDRNAEELGLQHLKDVVCGELNDGARRDLLLGLITLKYTQSNSVGYSLDGQMIGIGAGQQSRVDCTKLAGGKADIWQLQRHPKVLGLKFNKGMGRQDRINFRVRYIEGDLLPAEERALRAALDQDFEPLSAEEKRAWLDKAGGVSLTSDAFFPFRDNIDHAKKHGVAFVAQPGGSVRDDEVTEACREYGMAMVHTGIRLFHH
ncbi:MAG: phosphoribosylaminoimidazolecarboxamide formyltransferase [Myxococcales bacterium]|nr:phosphoribosylaminoimidazolecarboxamide formyltransferase [Myxococcales bacterium]